MLTYTTLEDAGSSIAIAEFVLLPVSVRTCTYALARMIFLDMDTLREHLRTAVDTRWEGSHPKGMVTRRVNLLVAELQDIFLGKAQADNTKTNIATTIKRIPLEEGLKLAGLTLVPTENVTGTNEAMQQAKGIEPARHTLALALLDFMRQRGSMVSMDHIQQLPKIWSLQTYAYSVASDCTYAVEDEVESNEAMDGLFPEDEDIYPQEQLDTCDLIKAEMLTILGGFPAPHTSYTPKPVGPATRLVPLDLSEFLTLAGTTITNEEEALVFDGGVDDEEEDGQEEDATPQTPLTELLRGGIPASQLCILQDGQLGVKNFSVTGDK